MPPLQRMSSRILGFLVATAAFTLLKLAFHGNDSLGIASKSENADNYPLLIDRQPIHVTIPEHSSSARTISIDTVDGEPTNQSNPEQTIGIQDSAQQKGTSLWIYVEEFSEGMATWRISFAEILMVAKRLNATVVEPCIGGGRLRTCRIAKYRLGQVYDLERLRQFHPHIASYAEYQTMLTRETPLIVTMCHQIQGGSPSPLMVCGQNVSNMFQVPSNHLLDQAMQQVNGTTVIHIMYYRKTGFQNTKVGRNRLVRPRFIESILADYFDFRSHHYETVDNLLRLMGISNHSDFDVIHWRAELPNIRYDECATKILQTRDAMKSNTTVLMSSLNRQASLQWFIPYRQGQAIQSLNRLSEAGMYKVDQALVDKGQGILYPDSVVLAIWDQIMALKATRFATCTKGCRQRQAACVQCNYLGNYAQMAIDLRSHHGKLSDECWPTQGFR